MTIDLGDRLAIHEILALYGHVIDQRSWDELDRVFTADAVFDATDFGLPVTHTLADLRTLWDSDDAMHPLAHHATNIVVGEDMTARCPSCRRVSVWAGRVASAV